MKRVLVIGAGRSASTAIQYLMDHAETNDLLIVVADYDLPTAEAKVGDHPRGKAIQFDVFNAPQRKEQVYEADIVLSFLPAHLHVLVAKDCIQYKTHLVTASYVSDEMAALDTDAKEHDVLLLNEIGADPGIDHMSAMEVIHRLKREGADLSAFRSYCGGLIAPNSLNEWCYKFTWAPRNVVLAGYGTAKYQINNRTKYLPYNQLFTRVETISVPEYGEFEAYANRDSTKYTVPYELEDVGTLYRATLRYPGYCEAWNAFIRLGLTEDNYTIPHSRGMSYRDFIKAYLPEMVENGVTAEDRLCEFLGYDMGHPVMQKLMWLDILSSEKTIDVENGTPAQILQEILERKWIFKEEDTDMVVMQHQFDYEKDGKNQRLISSMVVLGDDNVHSAISKTVGLPAAIALVKIMQGVIPQRGVHIPNFREVYEPVLKELAALGITFSEEVVDL